MKQSPTCGEEYSASLARFVRNPARLRSISRPLSEPTAVSPVALSDTSFREHVSEGALVKRIGAVNKKYGTATFVGSAKLISS